MTSHVIEIARQEGTEFRSVGLTLEDDGAIKMDAQDIGRALAPLTVLFAVTTVAFAASPAAAKTAKATSLVGVFQIAPADCAAGVPAGA